MVPVSNVMESVLGTIPSGPSSLEVWTEFQLAFPYRNAFRNWDCVAGSEMNVKLPWPSPIQKTTTGESAWDIQTRSASPSWSISPKSRLPGSDSPESNDNVFEDDSCRWTCICL